MKIYTYIPALVCIGILLSGCSVFYPNRMFNTPKGYAYAPLTDTVQQDHVLKIGDQFNLYIFTNRGSKLIDPLITEKGGLVYSPEGTSLHYEINSQGELYIPLVGKINLCGLTETQAEDSLDIRYKEFYIDPFIHLEVTNRRALVFRGNSEAKTIPIINNDMTILEAIVAAGGIPPNAKSKIVKIIRTQNNTPQISLIDLSTIDGLAEAETFVQPDDIIYVDPTLNSEFFKEVGPIIATISAVVAIYFYIANVKN